MVSERELPAGYSWKPADDGDLEGIRRIYNDAILHSVATFDLEEKSLADRRSWFAEHDGSHPVYVISASDGVAAWGSLSRWSPKRAYDTSAEVSIYVDEAHRGRGLGAFLLARLIEAGRTAGLHMLLSRIAEGNEASIRLHNRFEFRHVGTLREVGRKFGRFVDVEIYEYPL